VYYKRPVGPWHRRTRRTHAQPSHRLGRCEPAVGAGVSVGAAQRGPGRAAAAQRLQQGATCKHNKLKVLNAEFYKPETLSPYLW